MFGDRSIHLLGQIITASATQLEWVERTGTKVANVLFRSRCSAPTYDGALRRYVFFSSVRKPRSCEATRCRSRREAAARVRATLPPERCSAPRKGGAGRRPLSPGRPRLRKGCPPGLRRMAADSRVTPRRVQMCASFAVNRLHAFVSVCIWRQYREEFVNVTVRRTCGCYSSCAPHTGFWRAPQHLLIKLCASLVQNVWLNGNLV